MAQVGDGFVPSCPCRPSPRQEPPGHCSPSTRSLLSAGSPAAFSLTNQFLLLTAVLRKPSKTAKHGMQNKIQSEGLNYSRIENTQLIKSARHQPLLCAGPKAPLCLHVLLCSGPCMGAWGGAELNPAAQLPPGSILPLREQEGDCTSNTFGPVLSLPVQLRQSQSCAVSNSKIWAKRQ